MSHFTVIVTGDNVEEQLNPFQEVESEEWSAFVTKFYNELPNDTLLTVVDCHI